MCSSLSFGIVRELLFVRWGEKSWGLLHDSSLITSLGKDRDHDLLIHLGVFRFLQVRYIQQSPRGVHLLRWVTSYQDMLSYHTTYLTFSREFGQVNIDQVKVSGVYLSEYVTSSQEFGYHGRSRGYSASDAYSQELHRSWHSYFIFTLDPQYRVSRQDRMGGSKVYAWDEFFWINFSLAFRIFSISTFARVERI